MARTPAGLGGPGGGAASSQVVEADGQAVRLDVQDAGALPLVVPREGSLGDHSLAGSPRGCSRNAPLTFHQVKSVLRRVAVGVKMQT